MRSSSFLQCVIKYLMLFYIFPTFPSALELPEGVVKINSTALKSWYDTMSLCILEERKNFTTYSSALENCKKDYGGEKNEDAFYFLPPFGSMKSHLVIEEERGFDWSIRGFENGNNKFVSETLRRFSVQNMSVIFLGDSMSAQIFHAFKQELIREKSPGKFQYDILQHRPWFNNSAIHNSLGLKGSKALDLITDAYSWTPVDPTTNQDMNTVFLYCISMIHYPGHSQDETLVKYAVIPQLMLRDHPSGVSIFANIGHSVGSERHSPNQHPFIVRISHFLNYLHNLVAFNPGNIAFFRETTPAHLHEKLPQTSTDMNNTQQSNHNELSATICKPFDNTTDIVKRVPENFIVQNILEAWGTEHSYVNYLPMHDLLAPFHTLKVANCNHNPKLAQLNPDTSNEDKNKNDCYHYCVYAPPMWSAVWKEMLYQSSIAIRRRNSILQNNKYNIKRVFYPGSPTLPNVDEFFFEDLVLATDPVGNTYALYHGIKNRIQDNDRKILYDHFPYLKSHPIRHMILSEAELNWFLSGDDIERIKAFPDGTLIKDSNHHYPTIYFMEKGQKRVIPNWKTFVTMGFTLKQVKSISTEELASIEDGPPLPHKG